MNSERQFDHRPAFPATLELAFCAMIAALVFHFLWPFWQRAARQLDRPIGIAVFSARPFFTQFLAWPIAGDFVFNSPRLDAGFWARRLDACLFAGAHFRLRHGGDPYAHSAREPGARVRDTSKPLAPKVLSERVWFKHMLRNALISVVTIMSLHLAAAGRLVDHGNDL